MKNNIRKIGVLTSGGDAPGMNAAIRAVVRTAIYQNIQVYGVRYGYQGLIDNTLSLLESTDVSNIIQRGGTVLKSARSKDFMTKEGRQKAFEHLQQHEIDSLIVIGGDGTFRGAQALYEDTGFSSIGIPGTIDNDIAGTDYTIGFDTATNTAVDAIDKIRDTADAHDRLFIVEVMGRDAGYLALHSGLACGAEDILVPERITNVEQIVQRIYSDKKRKKLTNIIVVAEGDDFSASHLHHILQNRFPNLEIRMSVLGHIQRGGSPSCFDRIQASRMGYAAVNALLEGKQQVMVGLVHDQLIFTEFSKAKKLQNKANWELLEIAKVLAT